MENFSLSHFRERFYLRNVIESHHDFKVYKGRDMLQKVDVNILAIKHITKMDLDEVLLEYQIKYNPEVNVSHLGYCIQELDHGVYNFSIVYEATKILEDHLKERTLNLSIILTYEEVRYFFWRVASYQKFLSDQKRFYGCLQRKNLRIDKNNNIKLQLYPVMRNTFEIGIHRLDLEQSIDFDLKESYEDGIKQVDTQREFIFSPHLLDVLKKRNRKKIKEYEDWVQNDVFVLAMWCLYFFDNKILQRTINNDNFYIDYKAISFELQNIKFLINTNFYDLIKNCLRVDINQRLTIDYISEILQNLKADIQMGVNNVREAKQQAQENFENDLENEQYLPQQEKTYYYNKEVNRGMPRNVAAKRHLYDYTHKTPQKNARLETDYGRSISPNSRAPQSSFSPMRRSEIYPQNDASLMSRSFTPKKNKSSSVSQMSPFQMGKDKEFKPYYKTLKYLKKSMLHFIEKEIMPVQPYAAINSIKVGDKQFELREIEPKKHIGFILYDNQDIYFGEVIEFKRHGLGFYFNANNELFYGDFFEDLLEGSGQYYYKNGNICLGSWSKGYFHGVIHVYNKEKDSEYKCLYNLGKMVEIRERRTRSKNKPTKFATDVKCKNMKWFLQEGFHDTDLILKLIDICKGKSSKCIDSDIKANNDSLDKQKKLQRSKTIQENKELNEHDTFRDNIKPFVFLTELDNDPLESEADINQDKFDGRDLNVIKNQWVKYRGSMWDGKKHGLGELIYKDGHHYKGEFEYNVPHGVGVFYFKYGNSFCGNWKRGVLTDLGN